MSTLITYGNGELLEHTFNAIAGLMGNGNLIKSLFSVTALIGLSLSIAKSIYGNGIRAVSSWMGIFYTATYILLVPTTKLVIKDQVTQNIYIVDNVPYALGVFTSRLSQLSYAITEQIETAFADLGDLAYHKTGSMIASSIISEFNSFEIKNIDLQLTLRDYFKNCVFYTALRGRNYTIDDIVHSDDVWKLVSENPSKARHCRVYNKGHSICSCVEASKHIDTKLKLEIENSFNFGNNRLFSFSNYSQRGDGRVDLNNRLKSLLPLSSSYMLGYAKEASESMQQLLMINAFKDSKEAWAKDVGSNFAVDKARLQKRSSQNSMWGLGSKIVLQIKNVMEILIYVTFIFLLPLLVLPNGIRFLYTWGGLVLWINLWSPMYAILNMIATFSARKASMGHLLGDSGVTIYNIGSLSNYHADMAGFAGAMVISTGPLIYMLIKGGSSAMMHMTGGITGTASSAASEAGIAKMRGNFDWGNVSENNVNRMNSSLAQQNNIPNVGHGAFIENTGIERKIYGENGERIDQQEMHRFPVEISAQNAFGEKIDESRKEAINQQKTISEERAISDAENKSNLLDYASTHTKGESSGENYNHSINTQDSQQMHQALKVVDDFAHNHNINRNTAQKMFASASSGVPFAVFKAQIGTSAEESKIDTSVYTEAQNCAEESGLNKSLQLMEQAAKTGSYNSNDNVNKSLVNKMTEGFTHSENLAKKEQIAFNKSKALEIMQNAYASQGVSINKNMMREFVPWLEQRSLPNSKGEMGRPEARKMLGNDTDHMLPGYQNKFIQEKFGDIGRMINSDGKLNNEKFEQVFGVKVPTASLKTSNNGGPGVIEIANEAGLRRNNVVSKDTKDTVNQALKAGNNSMEEKEQQFKNAAEQRKRELAAGMTGHGLNDMNPFAKAFVGQAVNLMSTMGKAGDNSKVIREFNNITKPEVSSLASLREQGNPSSVMGLTGSNNPQQSGNNDNVNNANIIDGKKISKVKNMLEEQQETIDELLEKNEK